MFLGPNAEFDLIKCLDTFGVMVYMGFSFMDELYICVGGPLCLNGDKGENMIKIAYV